MICFSCGAQTETDPCPSCGGAVLVGGRYRVQGQAGRHHWRTTWLARSTKGDREVVIWEVPLPPGLDSRQRADFEREAGARAGNRHRGFAEVLDAIVVKRGRAQSLLVVEARVPGRTLRDVLDEHGAWSAERTLGLLAELLESLAWLHDHSTAPAHGDIRPETIVVADDADGRGMGFVLVGAATAPPSGGNAGGAVASGAPGYTAPERLRGEVDARADLYAVGAVALAVLAGRDARLLLDPSGRHRWEDELDLHKGLSLLLADLVQPDPTRRISSARKALQRVAEVQVALAALPRRPPEGGPDRAVGDRMARGLSRARGRMDRRYPTDAAAHSRNLLLVLIGVAMVVAALLAWREWRDRRADAPASVEPIH